MLALVPLLAWAQSSLPPCPSDVKARWHNCFGTITHPNGEKYIGEFRDDKYHGQGTYTFPDGRKYVGEVRDGKAHGQATFTWPDGGKYVGEYRDNKIHGQGTW
ncbi:MAG: hypothetical protein ACKO3C_08965, partial [Betaproteobacteria bacterium]